MTAATNGAMIRKTRMGERKTTSSNPTIATNPPSDNTVASCR